MANYPVDLFNGDCAFDPNMDAETNSTWKYAAPISSCTAKLFVDGVVPDSKAVVFWRFSPLGIQFDGTVAVITYLFAGTTLYYFSTCRLV